MKEVKQKSLFFSYYFSEINFNSRVYQWIRGVCETNLNAFHVLKLASRFVVTYQVPLVYKHEICHFDQSAMVRTEYVRLSPYSFFRANFKISTAIRELSRADGVKISRKTVRKYYKCFRQNTPIGDLPRSGRPPTIQHEHFDFIDQKLEENDELTASGKWTANTFQEFVSKIHILNKMVYRMLSCMKTTDFNNFAPFYSLL